LVTLLYVEIFGFKISANFVFSFFCVQ